MASFTHDLLIEIVNSPTNHKIRAECEFDQDGIASMSAIDLIDFDEETITLEQANLINILIDLTKRITQEFGEVGIVRVKKKVV